MTLDSINVRADFEETAMIAILNALSALSLPLGILNALGGIVAGVWLAIAGKWSVLGWGIAFFFCSTFALGFAFMPGLAFAAPGAYFYSRGSTWAKLLSYPFLFFSVLYNVVVITVWCVWTLGFFLRAAGNAPLIPVLLWAYGAATGPLAYMAHQEGEGGGNNTGSVMTTYFAQIAFVIMVVADLLAGLTISQGMFVFAFVMLVGMLCQFNLALRLQSEGKAAA
jgi:hypothetical protein